MVYIEGINDKDENRNDGDENVFWDSVQKKANVEIVKSEESEADGVTQFKFVLKCLNGENKDKIATWYYTIRPPSEGKKGNIWIVRALLLSIGWFYTENGHQCVPPDLDDATFTGSKFTCDIKLDDYNKEKVRYIVDAISLWDNIPAEGKLKAPEVSPQTDDLEEQVPF